MDQDNNNNPRNDSTEAQHVENAPAGMQPLEIEDSPQKKIKRFYHSKKFAWLIVVLIGAGLVAYFVWVGIDYGRHKNDPTWFLVPSPTVSAGETQNVLVWSVSLASL